MFGFKTRRLREELADEKNRTAHLRRRLHDTEEERDSWKWAAKETTSSRDDLVIKRTRERDEAVRNLAAIQQQLAGARDELDALQRKLVADRPKPGAELRDARRALMLSERARRQLDEQLVAVQAANESLCREAVDRAGTLALRGVSAP